MSALICILCGGPDFVIQVNGKRIKFEMHPYCGPNILNRRDEPLKHQPREFLHAASQWARQGRRVVDGLCVWEHEPKMITRHLGGRHWECLGYEPPVKGQ